MLKVGLTGAQASGKTTVLELFQKEGLKILSCDQLVREITSCGRPAFEKIVALFGPDILTAEGELNRRLIWEIISRDRRLKESLEAIIHPLVKEKLLRVFAHLPKGTIVVVEVPLLFEASWEELFDLTVAIWVPEEILIERLSRRYAISNEEARGWLRLQMSTEEKCRRADLVIDNSGSLEATEAQVQKVVAFLRDLIRKRNDPS
ncbi:dephospho-CoA kinase [Thermosulfuriphilus sp.]